MTVYNLKKTGAVINVNMMMNGVQNEKAARATEVGGIPLSHINPINMDKRLRPLDRENVNRLKRDIAVRGMLQPIGVRATKGDRGGPFDLIYGFHRYVAFCELHDEDDSDGRVASGTIPVVMYPASMTDNEVLAAECVENLLRKELTAAERAAHAMTYAGLLKKAGSVATVKERNADNGKKGGSGRPKNSGDKLLATAISTKPTVIEALQAVSPASAKAKDGATTSAQAIRDRFNKAKAVAGIHADKTLETATGDELIEMGEAALRNIDSHKAKMHDRNSKAGVDRGKRIDTGKKQPTAIEKVEAQLRGLVAAHGWDVLKNAIQNVWREEHAPEGRVVFNTTFGPQSEG